MKGYLLVGLIAVIATGCVATGRRKNNVLEQNLLSLDLGKVEEKVIYDDINYRDYNDMENFRFSGQHRRNEKTNGKPKTDSKKILPEMDDNLKPTTNPNSNCTNTNYDDLVTQVQFNVRRFISLFLQISDLKDYEIQDGDVVLDREVLVSISATHLRYLQTVLADKSANLELWKVDEILTRAVKLKELSLQQRSAHLLKDSLGWISWPRLDLEALTSPLTCYILCFLGSLVFYLTSSRSLVLNLFLLLNNMILVEGLMRFNRQLEAARLANFVALKQLKHEPVECNPELMSWYHHMANLFFEDPCLVYHRQIRVDPLREVSFLEVILDTYYYYLLEMTSNKLGSSLGNFTSKISAFLPYPFNWLAYCVFIVTFLGIMVPCFLSIVMGRRFEFAAMMGLFRVREADGPAATPRNRVQELQPQPVPPPLPFNLTVNIQPAGFIFDPTLNHLVPLQQAPAIAQGVRNAIEAGPDDGRGEDNLIRAGSITVEQDNDRTAPDTCSPTTDNSEPSTNNSSSLCRKVDSEKPTSQGDVHSNKNASSRPQSSCDSPGSTCAQETCSPEVVVEEEVESQTDTADENNILEDLARAKQILNDLRQGLSPKHKPKT